MEAWLRDVVLLWRHCGNTSREPILAPEGLVPKEAPSAPANPNYHSLANFTQMLQDELALEGSSS